MVDWNNKIKLFIILTITVLIILIFSYASFGSYGYNQDCLEKKGRELCSELGKEYDGAYTSLRPYFYCKENIRSEKSNRYIFLKEEVEECKNE